MALMVYKTCCKIDGGLPVKVKIMMLINIVIDFIIGIVPFLGDLVDAMFKANTRNVILLEQHLREKGQKELKKKGMPVPDIDPSSPEEYDIARRESGLPSRRGKTNRVAPSDEETGITNANSRSKK